MVDLDAIKIRTNRATKGPWQARNVGGFAVGLMHEVTDADAIFVGNVRTDVSALITEVEWLQSRLVRAHRMLLDDLAIIYPKSGSPVEQLKAKLLHEIQGYVEDVNEESG